MFFLETQSYTICLFKYINMLTNFEGKELRIAFTDDRKNWHLLTVLRYLFERAWLKVTILTPV